MFYTRNFCNPSFSKFDQDSTPLSRGLWIAACGFTLKILASTFRKEHLTLLVAPSSNDLLGFHQRVPMLVAAIGHGTWYVRGGSETLSASGTLTCSKSRSASSPRELYIDKKLEQRGHQDVTKPHRQGKVEVHLGDAKILVQGFLALGHFTMAHSRSHLLTECAVWD